MKIELILSKTYVCGGKVYNRGVIYEVSKKMAKHLLAQSNERNVFYFRRAADDGVQAYEAPKKSIDKGGVPLPVDEDDGADGDDSTPDPADDDAAPAVDADGEEVDDDADADEDDGDGEEAVTV